jgi:hypothetical protein
MAVFGIGLGLLPAQDAKQQRKLAARISETILGTLFIPLPLKNVFC